MFEDTRPWTIQLRKTTGKRRSGATAKRNFRQSCLVLYFAPERDWPSRSMERNSNGYGTMLCSAVPTLEAREYLAQKYRAHSLQYSGLGKANAQGLAEDLRVLGFDEVTITRFLEAAKPHWPIELKVQ